MSKDQDQENFELMAGETRFQSIEDIQVYQAGVAKKLAQLKLQQKAALAEFEARKKEQSSQGFFKKLWREITGKNKQLNEEIENTYRRVQTIEREMEHWREENARLQAKEHWLAHNDVNGQMKDIGKQTADLAMVGEKVSEAVVKLDQRMRNAEAVIIEGKENDWRVNERIGALENQLLNLLSLNNQIAVSNQQNFEYIKEHGQNLDMLLDALGEKEERDEQQNIRIGNIQIVLGELVETLQQQCQLGRKQNEDIAKVETAVSSEVEHGRIVDNRLGSLDISLGREIEYGRKLAGGVDSLRVSLNQTIDHSRKIDEKLGLLDQEDAKHMEMIHKLRKVTLINTIIASLAFILGIVLLVFKL